MNKTEKSIIIGLVVIAISLAGVFLYPLKQAYDITLPDHDEVGNEFIYGATPALANADYYERVHNQFIAEKKSFIEADLSTMKLHVYKEGEMVKEINILTKGREGSWWETPAGLYRIESKEAKHFSSIGKVYQPWSMAFQGNFFIHGWPYYPDGTEVASTYSGGCVRLSTEDAKIVYDLVSVGTPVLVYENDSKADQFRYSNKPPHVSAERYMIADLGNNTVISEKGMSEQVPVASITKLMTALVATEYINIEKNITITTDDLIATSRKRLSEGQEISVYNLLFPLLMESSNESALAIARSAGNKRFVALMNEKAKAINTTHSRFVDSYGGGVGNVSTAEDLFSLAKYILNNRSFVSKMTAGKVNDTAYGALPYADLKNFNVVPGVVDNFIGGKIGKTTASGETYMGVFTMNIKGENRPIVIILLNSTDVYADTRTMLAYLRELY